MVFENLKKLPFLIVQSAVVVVSASYYQKEFSGYLFTTYWFDSWFSNTQEDIQSLCYQNGSKLLAITNANIQNAAVAFINEAIQQRQMARDNIITDGKRTYFGKWTWINGTYTPKTLSIRRLDNNRGFALFCAYLNTTPTGFTLWAARSTDTKDYICEFAGQTPCVNGYQYGGQCFQSFSESVTWFEARNRCLMKGGDLATFEFITTNDGLNSLNGSSINLFNKYWFEFITKKGDLNRLSGSWINPSTQYWIGLRRQWWTWQSIASNVTYSQWADGQHDYYNFNDCLCLRSTDWKWIGCPCTHLSYGYVVCIRAASSSSSDSSSLNVDLCIGVPVVLTIIIFAVLLIRQDRIGPIRIFGCVLLLAYSACRCFLRLVGFLAALSTKRLRVLKNN